MKCDISLKLSAQALQGVSKKTPVKEMRDFLTLKMLPVALALIKPEKTPSFSPIGQKTPILHENFVIRTIFNVKWVFFDQWG